MAISTDQEIFLELTSQELERCTEVTNRRICPVIRASRRVLTTRSCVMSLFKNDPSKKELCTQVLTPWEGFYRFYSFYLGNRKWLYFDSQEKVVTYTCPDTRFRGTDTRSINKISILEVPRGCTIRSSNWILPPTFKTETVNVEISNLDTINILDAGLWFTDTPKQLATEDENFRQKLLNNISKQLITINQGKEIHQYTGMNTQRLIHLSAMMDEEILWGQKPNAIMVTLYCATVITFIILIIFNTWGFMKLRCLELKIQKLSKQLCDHEKAVEEIENAKTTAELTV